KLLGGVKEIVDAVRELGRVLRHGGELSERGSAHRARRAQAAKQARSQCRPRAGNLVEHRADGPVRPQLLVLRDREAVRLVTDLLQRLERGRGQVEDEGLEPIRRVYL